MAQIQDSQKNHQPRSSRITSSCNFLGCFGSSFVPPHKLKEKSKDTETATKTAKISSRISVSWFSWSNKKSQKGINVVFDAATDEKLQLREDGVLMAKSIKKVLAKPHKVKVPADGTAAGQIPEGTFGDSIVQRKEVKTKYEKAQKIILETSKSLTRLETVMKEATYKKGSSKRHSSSHNPPDDKNEVSHRATAVLSHSTSMPPPSLPKKPAAAVDGGGRVPPVKKDKSNEEKDKKGGKFDQFLGISIILVTLTIMVVWGKLVAILCTSAWLYCFPLIKVKKIEPKVTIRSGSKSFDLDMDSEEYKKKVVLEGLLERNRRSNGVGIS